MTTSASVAATGPDQQAAMGSRKWAPEGGGGGVSCRRAAGGQGQEGTLEASPHSGKESRVETLGKPKMACRFTAKTIYNVAPV